MTGLGGGTGDASEAAVARWRWRRPDPEDPFPLYAAPVPDSMLGEDGATVELTRSATRRSACPVCGRRARLWWAWLRLPAPWRPVGAYLGCTRDHAVALIPRDWRMVAEGDVLAAAAVAAEGRTSAWYRDRIARHRRLSGLGAWLQDQPPEARRLALTLWAAGDLDVEETAAIVAAVLAAPPACTESPAGGE